MIRKFLLLLLSLLFYASLEAYEIDFSGSEFDKELQIRFVPIPGNRYAVSYAGIHLCRLSPNPSDNTILSSKVNVDYSAKIDDNTVIVTCKNFIKTGACKLIFRNGRLLRFKRDAPDVQKTADIKLLATSPFKKSGIGQLWRPREKADDVAWRYWEKSGRIRLWYFNPNAAGALFAELALLVLTLGCIFRYKILRIVCAVACITFLTLLILSGSRGSFVAFLIGASTLGLVLILKRFSFRFVLVFLSVLLVCCGLLLAGFAGERFCGNLFAVDAGNLQRLRCWSAAPQMMADSPSGWGNNCGRSYCDWYQSIDDTHSLRWLVNSHLTWMVENGQVFRTVYVFIWMLIAVFLWRCRNSNLGKVALGQWITFFVALWFSTLGIFVSLWIIPVCTFLCAVYENKNMFKYTRLPTLTLTVVVVFILARLIVFCIEFGGGMKSKSLEKVPVLRDNGQIVVGDGANEMTLLHDGYVLTTWRNGVLGKEIRTFISCNKDWKILIADTLENLPKFSSNLVLVGRSGVDFLRRYITDLKLGKNNVNAEKIFFISPPFSPKFIPRSLLKKAEVTVFYGEYAQKVDSNLSELPTWAEVVPGAELYIPDWLERISKTKIGVKK